VTEPGKAPQRRIAVRPKDAVAWSLYYPSVLGGSDRGDDRLRRAAAALSGGQVDEARRLLDEARTANVNNPEMLAMSSVVALVADDKETARKYADQSLAANAKSPAALLARSLVAQADFDLDRARELAEKAAAVDPKNAEALARAAELRLAAGDYAGARKAAEDAVGRDIDNARALTVLGFVELAAYHTDVAARWFDRAVEADSGFPLAHAGRGISRIRQGHVADGREELQTAATLDPSESLYRSYLGKAYYEEKRSKEAGRELDAAKRLDPNDPTPFLYSAILLQDENRPIEALRDLNGAIERNGNRAVYRSRLLLDEDRAVRGTDLARIYNDLGFDALGLVAARRSADLDQANFSSHLFLAGNYRNVTGYASSFLSETLQARIYQPVGANAARPEARGGTVAFNEYTALFDRTETPRLRQRDVRRNRYGPHRHALHPGRQPDLERRCRRHLQRRSGRRVAPRRKSGRRRIPAKQRPGRRDLQRVRPSRRHGAGYDPAERDLLRSALRRSAAAADSHVRLPERLEPGIVRHEGVERRFRLAPSKLAGARFRGVGDLERHEARGGALGNAGRRGSAEGTAGRRTDRLPHVAADLDRRRRGVRRHVRRRRRRHR
jgi:tetratricopeptide (TPR) repeat protein